MGQRIHLAAIVAREGRVLLVRHQAAGEWELPGGPFLPEHTDPEAGMTESLREFGLEAETNEEHFVETLFLPDGEGHMVYNLYAAGGWSGEITVAEGTGTGWFAPGELDSVLMNAQVRDAVLEACGIRERPDPTAQMMRALQGQIGEVARSVGVELEPEDAGTGAIDRRDRGMEVLQRLRGGSPSAVAPETLAGRYGPLSGDVVDFVFGDVWSDPALDRKTRSLEVVAMLGVLGRTGPLVTHVAGALNHGATPAELAQTVRMIAVYGGFPAAVDAWAVVAAVLSERGLEIPGGPS